jgi:putative FmdB family regulatory protein
MAAYDYRCEQDGVFELSFPMGSAPSTAPCPECGAESPRSFSAPLTASPGGAQTGGWVGPKPPGGGPPPLSSLPMTAPMRGGFPPH